MLSARRAVAVSHLAGAYEHLRRAAAAAGLAHLATALAPAIVVLASAIALAPLNALASPNGQLARVSRSCRHYRGRDANALATSIAGRASNVCRDS